MLTADAELELRLGCATTFDACFDELANASLVEARERVDRHDLGVLVFWEERAGVVTAEAEASLREVVGAEAEELCVLRNVFCGQCSTWDLDHCSDGVFQLAGFETILLTDAGGCLVDDCLLVLELFCVSDKWDHDLWEHLDASLSGLQLPLRG